ncbi:hypothetical protein V500_01744 [Pseudogymnoascus sp. VKM F-4518 (FW-2643)]|nr:hypothetical protein V500_01744 [Pseudogymnoascus sp. VKM F-4518 (FW-2643)]
MDGDPSVEPQLDSFSRTLPLPYRCALIIVAAVWAWGANLQYLSFLKIDVPALIRYPGRQSLTEATHHLSTYRLATILSGSLGLSLVTFWIFSHRDAELVIFYDWMPMTYLLFLALLFILPLRYHSTTGRYHFLKTLRRVSVGGIAEAKDGKFGDILLADVLTSYSKILADLFISVCMFLTTNGSATEKPDRRCGGRFLVPLIIAIPSAIRFRQCLIEYRRVQDANHRTTSLISTGSGGVHLANALKYATAFPVIILSALQRSSSDASTTATAAETSLYRLWLLAVIINSLYSFYWDVANDWDLTLLSPARSNPEHPYGLRRKMVFRASEIYYVAIGLDFLLRITWTLKLSPHLDQFNDWEGGIFCIQALEVFRRWIWIFFRVETEWVRNTSTGLGQDDILLGDYSSGKDDDD